MTPPVNGNFVGEGTFFAMPPCFPGVSLPPSADELRMGRLFVPPQGKAVFATTRGPRPHLLKFLPKGELGYAVDLGCPPEVQEITAMVGSADKEAAELVVACSTPVGASLFVWHSGWADDGIQEWQVGVIPPRHALDLPVPRIFALARHGDLVFAAGEGVGFYLRQHDKKLTLEQTVEIPNVFPDLFSLQGDCLLSSDWRLLSLEWDSHAIGTWESLPHDGPPVVAAAADGRFLVWADETGTVYEYSGGEIVCRGKIPLSPARALCRLPDGRIYVSAGPEIGHWYVLESGHHWARDLGVPVSTLAARRYGLQFSHMLAGRDCEIYVAEDDRGGHLWLYFPPLLPQSS